MGNGNLVMARCTTERKSDQWAIFEGERMVLGPSTAENVLAKYEQRPRDYGRLDYDTVPSMTTLRVRHVPGYATPIAATA